MAELRAQSHTIGANKMGELRGYSLLSHRKVVEGAANYPDRDAQFQWIDSQTVALEETNQPVLSVDAKKKELVGSLKMEDRSVCHKESLR